MTPTEIKMECLRLASIRTPDSNSVLELAKSFEQYVTGDDATFLKPKASVTAIDDRGPNGRELPRDPNIYADT